MNHWRSYVALSAGLGVLFNPFVRGRRVPLLGWFDLGIHELGHLVFRLVGETVHFVMGSGAQILVPLGLAGYFWLWQRHHLASGLMLCWAATSMQDVSVYIADAPYRNIELIGGTHDWWWLLRRWDKFEWADELARGVWLVGLLVGLAGLVVVLWPVLADWWGRRPAEPVTALGPTRRKRPPL
jgi:hypothetical protein